MVDHSILRAGAAQLTHAIAPPSDRLSIHREMIDRARAEKLDLLVFPETSLCGYASQTEVRRVAIKAEAPELKQLAETSSGLTSVIGFIEQAEAGLLYNALAWVRDGEILSIHRKINLATYGNLEEGKCYAKGDSVTTVPLQGDWVGGGLICADLWNPSLLHVAALSKVTVLAAPIASAVEAVGGEFDNPANWDLTSRYGAMMYGLPTIRCNWAGEIGAMKFWGGSALYNAYGKEIARAGDGQELIIGEFDYNQLTEARFLLPTLRDADPHLLLKQIQRLVTP